MMTMKISLLNVKYSPNLGDGIIAECLEHALSQSDDVSDVSSCDLAGRTEFGKGLNGSRQKIRRAFSVLPKGVRQFFMSGALKALIKFKLSQHYSETLQGADCVVIGGGQLIADKDLNFPRKISGALHEINLEQTPVAIYSAGVAKDFSKKGHFLFQTGFNDRLASVHVRDELSVERWNRTFHQPTARKVWDPGFLASEIYPTPFKQKRVQPIIGLGITHPQTLSLHSDNQDDALNSEEWISFFCRVASELQAQGASVELFTNGAADDQEFARTIQLAYLEKFESNPELTLAETPLVPAELAATIGYYDAVISHRLHANIVAYSFSIPHVGLGWDSKMQGYFSETHRSDFLVTAPRVSDAQSVGALAMRALKEGIQPALLMEIQHEIHQQSRNLVKSLSASLSSMQSNTNRVVNLPKPFAEAGPTISRELQS